MDPTDVIKFGKKVNYESKETKDMVMEEHLRQMRCKMELAQVCKDRKKKQEKEFLEHIKELEKLDKARYSNGRKMIKNDFLDVNGKIQLENQLRRDLSEKERKTDKYTHFPFVSGDLIEKHRAVLGAQLKNDL